MLLLLLLPLLLALVAFVAAMHRRPCPTPPRPSSAAPVSGAVQPTRPPGNRKPGGRGRRSTHGVRQPRQPGPGVTPCVIVGLPRSPGEAEGPAVRRLLGCLLPGWRIPHLAIAPASLTPGGRWKVVVPLPTPLARPLAAAKPALADMSPRTSIFVGRGSSAAHRSPRQAADQPASAPPRSWQSTQPARPTAGQPSAGQALPGVAAPSSRGVVPFSQGPLPSAAEAARTLSPPEDGDLLQAADALQIPVQGWLAISGLADPTQPQQPPPPPHRVYLPGPVQLEQRAPAAPPQQQQRAPLPAAPSQHGAAMSLPVQLAQQAPSPAAPPQQPPLRAAPSQPQQFPTPPPPQPPASEQAASQPRRVCGPVQPQLQAAWPAPPPQTQDPALGPFGSPLPPAPSSPSAPDDDSTGADVVGPSAVIGSQQQADASAAPSEHAGSPVVEVRRGTRVRRPPAPYSPDCG